MASNTDVVKKLYYNMSVLCLYLRGVWHLVGTEVVRKQISHCVRRGVNYPQLFFVLYLQRKPNYYVINILLPCLFLTSIAMLVSNHRLVAKSVVFSNIDFGIRKKMSYALIKTLKNKLNNGSVIVLFTIVSSCVTDCNF